MLCLRETPVQKELTKRRAKRHWLPEHKRKIIRIQYLMFGGTILVTIARKWDTGSGIVYNRRRIDVRSRRIRVLE